MNNSISHWINVITKSVLGCTCMCLLITTNANASSDVWQIGKEFRQIALDSHGQITAKIWTIIEEKKSGRKLQLLTAILPTHLYRVSIVPVDKSGPIAEIFEGISCSDGVVLSGSFYQSKPEGGFKAIGLIVEDGQTLSPVARWTSGGAFIQDADGTRIVPVRELSALKKVDQAMQGKPIVLRNGISDMRGDDGINRWSRAFIGIADNSDLFLSILHGSSKEGASLYEAAEILAALRLQREVPVKDVLALDGGPSAHVYIPYNNRHFGAAHPVYVPNVICMRPNS